MSWRRLFSRGEVPTAPRKYFVVTMLVALMLHSAGNSTPCCSLLFEPSRLLVLTTSRRSQVTSSYGCTPGVVKTRLTFKPFPRAGALPPRRARPEDRRSSVSVMSWSSPSVRQRLGKNRSCVLLGLVYRLVLTVFSGAGGGAGLVPPAAAAGRREVGLHARQRRRAARQVPAPELADLLLEVLEGVERAVDAGEAEVPHLVAGHLGHAGRPDGVLHLLGQFLQLVLVHRTPLAGAPHAGDDLGPVERLADPAALDDGEHRLLDGGEPPTAARARAAPPGGRALVGFPRVDDPAVGVVAERAPHGDPPPSRAVTRGCCPPPPCGLRWGHPVDVRGRTWGSAVDGLTSL